MTADQDCIFCKIATGELGTEFVHETDRVVAFNDMAPLASYHILVVPKAHIPSIDAVTREHDDLLGEMIAVVQAVAEARGLKQSGYRLVTNFGHDAGQTVNHLHFHVLGGNSLGKMA